MRYLVLFFIIIPFAEIFLLITVSHEIGPIMTISLVLLTAGVGLLFLRKQGLEVLFRARNKINVGDIPAKEMIEAIIIAFSGVLLVMPGFATDLLGFFGLVPIFRAYFLSGLASKFFVKNYSQNFSQSNFENSTDNKPNKNRATIDAEYWSDDQGK